MKSLSRVRLLATPWTAAYQTPPSMGFSRQEYWSGVPLPSPTEWGRQRLTEFCQKNALVIANTFFQQHKRRLYTWTSPDGQYWKQIDYILCSQSCRSSIESVKTRLGADCGSDRGLLNAKFRLKLKKGGKTTRPFSLVEWCKSNPSWLYSGSDRQIPGIRSDRQSAWRTMDGGSWHFTGGSDQDHPQEKEMQRGKIVVWGGLTKSWEKKIS